MLYFFTSKSLSAIVSSPPSNWDFQRFAEGNFEGILTDACNSGHIDKYEIDNDPRSYVETKFIKFINSSSAEKANKNFPEQNFRTNLPKETNFPVPRHSLDDTTHERVHELHILSNGPVSGAVCLDGSPPGLYLRSGSGSGKSKWIIFFQGGAWCHRADRCYKRSSTALGSSKCFRKTILLEGLLSNQAKYNPDFYNWTSVFVPYCDGASFTGNREKPLKFKNKLLYFRGQRILDAVLDGLLRRGIDNASEIILSGRSAGALAAVIHADYFRTRFRRATNASFRVLADGGFFMDEPSLNGTEIVRLIFQEMYSLHNSSTGLNHACLRAQERQQKWRCFFPQYSIPFVTSPIFIVNPLYDLWQLAFLFNMPCVLNVKTCNSKELLHMMKFRKKTLDALRSVFVSKNTAVFADACLAHTQCVMNEYWTQIEVENVTIAQAFVNWCRGRNQDRFMIDCSYSCNPTCPERYHW